MNAFEIRNTHPTKALITSMYKVYVHMSISYFRQVSVEIYTPTNKFDTPTS